jgi:queuine tRNA-ribosyltransferase
MATRCSSFEETHRAGQARRGRLSLPHGIVNTPAFMPVGTAGSVKALDPRDIEATNSEMVLANTYHLWVRPGHKAIQSLGGLHGFMNWDKPILTDSGGFQIFSLKKFCKVKEEGVRFRSPMDGAWRFLSPELAIEIQENLGVDVAMVLDECIEWPAERERVAQSTARTTRWLKRCLSARKHADRTAVFGIVQGGFYADLRVEHAQELAALDLDGYAIGGLSVGEPKDSLLEMVSVAAPHLPQDRPRYLMGVGYPWDIVEAATRGIDLFDCVLPTRSARFGGLFTSMGRVNIKHARYKVDSEPLDTSCTCYTCRSFSRAYLRHLFISGEALAPRLLTLHNLTFYQRLMQRLREAISAGPEAVESLRQEAWTWERRLGSPLES